MPPRQGVAVPKTATFFVNYVMLQSLGGFALQLAGVAPLLVALAKRRFFALVRRVVGGPAVTAQPLRGRAHASPVSRAERGRLRGRRRRQKPPGRSTTGSACPVGGSRGFVPAPASSRRNF